ncbi:MAG: single-stranded DNA-binding protein [Lachnospiraceae bacterium]|nr:single-stranded DNA-binding protein [Lachnospiraceae bacterium]MDD6578553.1 single-stranded DNA-binding protein [Lachnospiraceae bacterium]
MQLIEEFVEKSLKKGTKILLSGEIRNDNYTNKEGQKVHGTQIITNSIEFAESKNASGNTGKPQRNQVPDNPQMPDNPPDDDFFRADGVEENLPFN